MPNTHHTGSQTLIFSDWKALAIKFICLIVIQTGGVFDEQNKKNERTHYMRRNRFSSKHTY